MRRHEIAPNKSWLFLSLATFPLEFCVYKDIVDSHFRGLTWHQEKELSVESVDIISIQLK